MDIDPTLLAQAQVAKAASRRLAGLSTLVKNRALEAIADSLLARRDEVLAANAQDVERGRDAGPADAPPPRRPPPPHRPPGQPPARAAGRPRRRLREPA